MIPMLPGQLQNVKLKGTYHSYILKATLLSALCDSQSILRISFSLHLAQKIHKKTLIKLHMFTE